jgi:penicillin-binding protein 1C
LYLSSAFRNFAAMVAVLGRFAAAQARPDARWRRPARWAALAIACGAALWLAAFVEGASAVAPVRAAVCGPLEIVDRAGRVLRSVPARCGHRGRAQWSALREVPPLLRRLVIASEDKRFESHLGVDPLAVVRAGVADALAGRRVSGASTLSMQLARMLHQSGEARTFGAKLRQAWLAFALERRMSKDEILEAYLNHAYYGAGAYGVAEAARAYFAKAPRALSDGEAALLAVLPRAPSAYDPRRHLDAALARRARVLRMLVAAGALTPERLHAIETEPIALRASPPAPFEAGHFVDAVLASVPDAELRAGGVLRTTLDLDLQHRLERAVADHVARSRDEGVTQAAVVVLDTATSEVRALVGSADYAAAQVDMVTRRRQLGSLLKPFAYGLAMERGESASSVALDIGDVPSDYRARDWVGREAGPLSYREALAGSYNLAAVHVLEHVGVEALRARLRQAGVGELDAAPDDYGLLLALGSARVRLLDVAAGYGFLVRDGFVRRAQLVDSLERLYGPRAVDDAAWRPPERGESRLFSSAVSSALMDVLSDAAARHRRFGRDLPVEGAGDVVVKTGTASGMSDVSAVVASREFIVAAWAGRTDGAPSEGMSGMWGAAPLARRALDIALGGRAPSLPARSATMATRVLDGGVERAPSREVEPWAARARVLSARTPSAARYHR